MKPVTDFNRKQYEALPAPLKRIWQAHRLRLDVPDRNLLNALKRAYAAGKRAAK